MDAFVAALGLPGSNLILAILLPIALGMVAAGVVVAVVTRRWTPFVGSLALAAVVAALGVGMRWWVSTQTSPDQLAEFEQGNALSFAAMLPWGLAIGLAVALIALAQFFVSRRRNRAA